MELSFSEPSGHEDVTSSPSSPYLHGFLALSLLFGLKLDSNIYLIYYYPIDALLP